MSRFAKVVDLRIKRIFYLRALKMGLMLSTIGSVAVSVAVAILLVALYYMGVFSGLESILAYYPVTVTPKGVLLAFLAFMGATFVLTELSILLFVWLYNLSSTITGGIVVKFESMD